MTSRKCAYVLIAGAALLALSTCGGSKSSNPTPVGTPTPTPTAVRTDLGGSDFNVRPGGSTAQNIDFPPVGTMDITANWAGSDNIDVYATDANCPGFDQVTAGACPILSKGDSPTAKPEHLTFTTVANKIYTIWTANRGNQTEAVNLQFGITTLGPIPPPAAQPTPVPGSSPSAPRASPTPADLAAGPVTQVKAYVKSIDTGGFNYRPGEQDANGNWIVHPGEFVVFDMTQRNAAGLICNWIVDPQWSVDDPDGILTLKDSSQPFFLRTIIAHNGHFELQGTIDGIDSNVLQVTAVPNGN